MFLLWLPLLVNVTNKLLAARAEWEVFRTRARDTKESCVLGSTPTLSDILLEFTTSEGSISVTKTPPITI